MVTVLPVVWASVLALAGVTLATSVAMIMRRALRDQADRLNGILRAKTLAALLGQRSGNACDFSKPVVAEALLGLLTLVHGETRERIIDSALDGGAPRALRRLLRSRVAAHRMLAAEALGFFHGAATRRALAGAIRDRDRRVQTAARRALRSPVLPGQNPLTLAA